MCETEKTVEEFYREVEFAYELHEFQMSRLIRLIQAVKDKFGDEVLDTVKEADVNYKELLSWYLKRTASILDSLKDKFGEEVIDIVKQSEIQDRLKEGSCHAAEMGCNTLDGLLSIFGVNNIIEKNDNGILIRRNNGCPASRISRELALTDWMYILHGCYTDPHFVEGYNNQLCCEVRKSHMCGNDYCEWYIYDKKTK